MSETSMYGMIKPINAMGAVEGGMRMRDMIDERKKKTAIQGAYKAGTQIGPDGKVTVDHNLTATALAKGGYGQEAYQAQQMAQTEQQKQMELAVKQSQYGAQVLGSARSQAEWDQGLQQLQNNGMDASKLPAQYSPATQKMLVDSAMTLGDRLAEQWKQKEYGLKEREVAAKEREAGLKRDAKLPVADQKLVEDSAGKYSSTVGIKDSMDEVLSILDDPNIPYAQKMAAAQGSLKLVNSASLNSPDVVGAEEAGRVGAFLNPSITNGLPGRAGPMFKPDLEAYTDQLRNITNGLGNRANKYNERIAQTTGAGLRGAQNYRPSTKRPGAPRGGGMGINEANAADAPKVFKSDEIDW